MENVRLLVNRIVFPRDQCTFYRPRYREEARSTLKRLVGCEAVYSIEFDHPHYLKPIVIKIENTKLEV